MPWNTLANIPTTYAGFTHVDVTEQRQDVFGPRRHSITQKPSSGQTGTHSNATRLAKILSYRTLRLVVYATELALFGLNCMLLNE